MALKRSLVALVLLIAVSSLMAAQTPAIDPRPLSATERAAVDLVTRYLAGDIESVWNAVDPASPLRALGREAAMREIEARLGPPLGSEWELRTVVPSLANRVAVFAVGYPSGIDDTITMVFTPETRKLRQIVVLAEPSPFADPELLADSKLADDDGSPTSAKSQRPILLLGIAAIILGFAAPIIRLRSRAFASVALAIAAIAFTSAAAWHIASMPRIAPESAKPGSAGVLRLGELVEMRKMMATSNSAGISSRFQRLPAGDAGTTAQLWRAQVHLNAMEFTQAGVALTRFKGRTAIPLVEVLRARHAIARAKESEAAVAYERASSLGPGHDGIWSEASSAFWIGGFSDMARHYLDLMVRSGSRDADLYYIGAQLAAIDGEEERASQYFRAAWQLAPVPRESVLSEPVLWTFLNAAENYPLLELNRTRDPVVAPRNLASTAISWPAGAEVSVSGDQLAARVGEASLRVPFGAPLAPADAAAVSADRWERAEEVRASGEIESLIASVSTPAALTQPLLRRRVQLAASHLARKNDWSSVARITESFAVSNENVPLDLLMLRAVALKRLGRNAEASKFVLAIADSPVVKRRANPMTLMMLAELVASFDQFDAAIKLYDRADRKNDSAAIDDRVRQISTARRLHNEYQTHSTQNFDIRYPRETIAWRAQKVGIILEAELKRLQKWIPLTTVRRTEVQLLPWQDFQATFAMSENMTGLYDGRIRVPLADIPYLPPQAVAILSHELAHAMVAQATDDRAPHWFQEGIAQRIEMLPYRANSGVMYEDARFLATSSVEAVLRGFPDPQLIEQAYIESHTIMQYIDARFGSKAIHEMLRHFRDGADTETAIARACGRSLDEFDAQFLAWSRTEAPAVWTTKVISYDGEVPAAARPAAVEAPREQLASEQPRLGTSSEVERKKPVIPDSLRKSNSNSRLPKEER